MQRYVQDVAGTWRRVIPLMLSPSLYAVPPGLLKKLRQQLPHAPAGVKSLSAAKGKGVGRPLSTSQHGSRLPSNPTAHARMPVPPASGFPTGHQPFVSLIFDGPLREGQGVAYRGCAPKGGPPPPPAHTPKAPGPEDHAGDQRDVRDSAGPRRRPLPPVPQAKFQLDILPNGREHDLLSPAGASIVMRPAGLPKTTRAMRGEQAPWPNIRRPSTCLSPAFP